MTKEIVNSYTLRTIPETLWDRAKHQAIEEKTTLRGLLLKALEEYLERRKK